MANRKDPIVIIGIVLAAIEKAAQWIGSVEWKGRFRKRTGEEIEALQSVTEAHQEAMAELAEVVKVQQEQIKVLTDRQDFLVGVMDEKFG